MSALEPNPYAAPAVEAAASPYRATETTPTLWNPSAVVNWSVLFTPIFGAYLHMKNWEALGEPEKAAKSKMYLWGTFALVIGSFVVGMIAPSVNLNFLGIVALITWYYGAAREQMDYVKSRFGGDYPRRAWTAPLLIAGVPFTLLVTLVVIGAANRE